MSEPHLVHGVDIVDVQRFERWLNDSRAGIRQRFTPEELRHADDVHRAEHLAGCFAAKEAVLKALGLGAGSQVPWTDIELLHDSHGAPILRLSGRAEEAQTVAKIHGFVVSLSHSGGLALASVIGLRESFT